MSASSKTAALDAYRNRRKEAAGRSYVSSVLPHRYPRLTALQSQGYKRVLPRDVERRLERLFAAMDKNHDWVEILWVSLSGVRHWRNLRC